MERYVMKVPDKPGRRVVAQFLIEILMGKNGIEFKKVGSFTGFPGFAQRKIHEPLRGHGLGSAALKSFLAAERGWGETSTALASLRKSTLLLLLRNGFVLDEVKSTKAMQKLGVRNRKELLEFLQKQTTHEDLEFLTDRNFVYLTKSLRPGPARR